MLLYINNKEEEFQCSDTVYELLRDMNLIEKKGIAIAVNNEIVSKTDWRTFKLKENDRITIIKASQGG